MAEGQAPAPLTYPSQSSADPFSATFYANQAALELSRNTTLAGDQLSRRLENASSEYSQGVNDRAEPRALTANRNTANSQGLAESGVLAQRQGVTQTGYAQKDASIQAARRAAIERLNTGENAAVKSFEVGTNKNVAEEGERKRNQAIEEGAQQTAPTGLSRNPEVRAGQERATATGQPIGYVRQKAQPTTGGLRSRAVRKAKGGVG
jgi:hypothetical protein